MLNEQMNRQPVRPAQAGRTTPVRCTQLQPVWFEYRQVASREVTIAGTFNQWNVSDTRMVRLRAGRWVRVLFLPPGRYEYLFVVDRCCVVDPRAMENVPNIFGCANSVLNVTAPSCRRRRSQFATARRESGTSHRRPCRAATIPRRRAAGVPAMA